MADGKHGRFVRRARTTPTTDDRCTVRVLVEPYTIVDGKWAYKKGNISRTTSVEGARVSEVFDAIERALFGSSSSASRLAR